MELVTLKIISTDWAAQCFSLTPLPSRHSQGIYSLLYKLYLEVLYVSSFLLRLSSNLMSNAVFGNVYLYIYLVIVPLKTK